MLTIHLRALVVINFSLKLIYISEHKRFGWNIRKGSVSFIDFFYVGLNFNEIIIRKY